MAGESERLSPKAREQIDEILRKGERVGDKPPVAGTRPAAGLNPTAREQINQILRDKKFGEEEFPAQIPRTMSDLNNEPLPSPEREQVRALYQKIVRFLPLLGFTPYQIQYPVFDAMKKQPLEFIGVSGKYAIDLGPSAGPLHTQGGKCIRIETYTHRKDGGLTIGEWYTLIDDGRLSFSVKDQKGQMGEYLTEKAQLALERTTELVDALSASMNNPEYSPDNIRRKLGKIRGSLLATLESHGIVPKEEKRYFRHEHSLVDDLVERAGGRPMEEKTYEYHVGHVYEGVLEIPGVAGLWDVSFDIDQPNIYMRIDGVFTPAQKARGLGIIISQEGQAKNYTLWANGDASSPNGWIRLSDSKEGGLDLSNPHQVLKDFLVIKNIVTGEPLPPEIFPPPKPGLIKRFFRR